MADVGQMTLDSIVHRVVHIVGLVTVVAAALYATAILLGWAKRKFHWSWIPDAVANAPETVTNAICGSRMGAQVVVSGGGSPYAQSAAAIGAMAEGGIGIVLASQKCGHCATFVEAMLLTVVANAKREGVDFKVFDMDTMPADAVQQVVERLAAEGLPIEYVPFVFAKFEGTFQKLDAEISSALQQQGTVVPVTRLHFAEHIAAAYSDAHVPPHGSGQGPNYGTFSPPDEIQRLPGRPSQGPGAAGPPVLPAMGGAVAPRGPRADHQAGPARAARAEAAPPASRPAPAFAGAARSSGRSGSAAAVNFA